MRNTEDQLKEIMKRSEHIQEKKASQKSILTYGASALVCLVLMIVTGLHLPGISSAGTSGTQGDYGSLMLNTAYMGFVAIGVLAFLLGIFLTLICMQFRRMKNRESDQV